MELGLGSIVKAKVEEIEENTRDRIIKSTRKEVMGCVQAAMEKNILLVQFGDVQRKEMISILLVFLSSK